MALYSVVGFGVVCFVVTVFLLVIDTFFGPSNIEMKRSPSTESLLNEEEEEKEEEKEKEDDYDQDTAATTIDLDSPTDQMKQVEGELEEDSQGDMENASLVSDSDQSSDDEIEEGISFSAISRLPFSFWLVVLVVFTMQSTLYSFFALGSDFFQFQYGKETLQIFHPPINVNKNIIFRFIFLALILMIIRGLRSKSWTIDGDVCHWTNSLAYLWNTHR